MNKNTLLKGISFNVLILGVVSLLTDISSEMILPVLPIFLTAILGANMVLFGIIEGLAETTASLLKVFSGYYSDKIKKRKPLIFLGYGISAISKPFLAFSFHWTHVLGVRVSDRVGKGIRVSPRDALVSVSTEKKHYGKAFGIHRAMDTTGAIFGPLIAFAILFFFLPIETTIRMIFFLSVIPAFIGVILIVFFVKDIENKEDKISNEKKEKFKFSFSSMSKEFKFFLIISAIFSFGNFSYGFFLLRAVNLGTSLENVILLYLAFNIVYALTSIPMGILSDKIGKKKVIIIGYSLLAITSFGFAVAFNWIHAIIFFLIYGLFMGTIEGAQRAYISDVVEKDVRATALGTFNTVIGVVVFPASLIAGLLWDSFGVSFPFYFSVLTSLIALGMFTIRK